MKEFKILSKQEHTPDQKQYISAILQTVLSKKNNSFAESLLQQNKARGLSEKQLLYILGPHPKGYKTFEEQAKIINPGFDKNIQEDSVKEIPQKYPDNAGRHCTSDDLRQTNTKTWIEPVNASDVTLISTKGYPYQFPFFNPVQSLVYPHRNSDCNIVIGANTSAGKTICAEILMDEVLKSGKRVIYLSPLKSLTSEKHHDWQIRYPDEKICIMTGDYTLSDKKSKELNESRIICMTSEMADSRSRKFYSEKNYWMKETGLVIVDESHIISTERGHAVEVGLMRFTSLVPGARVLLLSATMPNVGELGEWLTHCNNKKTEIVYCNWRPVQLQMNFIEYQVERNYFDTQDNKIKCVIDAVQSKPDEKFLIFVHDKGTGRKIIQQLQINGIDSKFHSADLSLNNRKEIEDSFRNRENGLRVMVSTSTTAWGVNLPARNVVICGIHRGINEVDELDIIQMAGRAGRAGIDDAGFVHFIIPSGDTQRWQYIFNNPRAVLSKLLDRPTLLFHILSEIKTGNIRNSSDIKLWYSRSLAHLQGTELTEQEIQEIINQLEKMQMITTKWGLKTTSLGDISAIMYFNPFDIYSWFRNFSQLIKLNLLRDDRVIAWALSDIYSNNSFIPKNQEFEINKIISYLMKSGIENINRNSGTSILAAYNNLSGNDADTGLSVIMRSQKFDIKRQAEALIMMNSCCQWGCDNFFKALPYRIIYGIGMDCIELVKIKGVGGAKAKKLIEAGYRSKQDIIDNPDGLYNIFTPAMCKKILKEIEKE